MAAAVIMAGSAVAGGFMQYQGQKEMVKAQQKAEKLRERQMNLQAARERRETIRQSILARSTALATTTSQGASASGSSALAGAYGQISGDKNRQLLAINQNQSIGQGIFKANRQYSDATLTQGIGTAITGIGSAVSSAMSGSSLAGKSFKGIPIS